MATIVPVEFGSGKRGFQVAFQIKSKPVRNSFSMIKDVEMYAAEQRANALREELNTFFIPY